MSLRVNVGAIARRIVSPSKVRVSPSRCMSKKSFIRLFASASNETSHATATQIGAARLVAGALVAGAFVWGRPVWRDAERSAPRPGTFRPPASSRLALVLLVAMTTLGVLALRRANEPAARVRAASGPH